MSILSEKPNIHKGHNGDGGGGGGGDHAMEEGVPREEWGTGNSIPESKTQKGIVCMFNINLVCSLTKK